MVTTQPYGYLGETGQYPGGCTRRGFSNTGFCRGCQRQQQGFKLRKVTGNQHESLLDAAMFQCQQVQTGRSIKWITTETVNRFSGIGDYLAKFKLAYRFADFPAHVSLLSFSALGIGSSQGSTNLHSGCGQTRWVPERFVVLIDVIGQ